jgi:lipoprotein-releasing system permease protein
MGVDFLIAWRYIKSRHRMNFITIISYLSTAGITIGVAALIIVLSVFNGFGSLVTSYLISLDPHVRIEAKSEKGMQNLGQLEDMLRKDDRVHAYTPYVSGKVLIMHENATLAVSVKGIDPYAVNNVCDIGTYLHKGTESLHTIRQSDGTLGLPRTILGAILAYNLGVVPGDTVTVISSANIEQMLTVHAMPLMVKAVVAGTYYSKSNDYDVDYMFMSIDAAQYLLGFDNTIQGYEARLNNKDDAASVQKDFNSHVNKADYTVSTWYDLHRELFTVMKIERWVAYLLLSLIILIAVFNILASLTMSVIEKKRDIGILRTMGMEQKKIRKIYFYQGLIVGLIGTLAGFALGYFVYWLQVTYVIYPLDPMQFKISALPIELRWTDFIAVGVASLGLSLAAAFIPAKRAAKVDPLESIRWE